MYEKLICKHLQDADRLEIVEITRISDEYLEYRCPICKVEGKIMNPVYLNKWEYWRILQILKSANEHSGSTANRCFIENVIRIVQHLYNDSSIDSIKFDSIVDEKYLPTET